jgi:GAF domain-containing protein
MGEGIIGQIATDRQALLLEDASVDPRLENADTVIPIISLMGVPMVNEGKVVGVICAINSRRNERPFSPEQFSRLRFIASQVVLAQNLVQVYANLSEQQRINQELEFAGFFIAQTVSCLGAVSGQFIYPFIQGSQRGLLRFCRD